MLLLRQLINLQFHKQKGFLRISKIKLLATSIDISELLFDMLSKYDELYINGIGTFTKSAATDDSTSGDCLFSPTDQTVFFNPNVKAEKELLQCAVEEYRLGAKKQNKLAKEIQEKINTFLNFGKFDMGDFGKVVKNENGELIFKSGESAPLNKENHFLPDLKLKPVKKKSKTEDPQKIAQPIVADVAPEPTVPKPTTQSHTYQSSNTLIKYFPIAISLLALAFIGYFLVSWITGGSSKPSVTESGEVTAQPKADASEGESPLFSNDMLVKYQGILTPEIIATGCTIVVGTFSKVSSAEQLQSSIAAQGYTANIVAYNSMNRVIINFDCANEDLNNYLAQVRADVDPKAWYLVPPEYRPFDQ